MTVEPSLNQQFPFGWMKKRASRVYVTHLHKLSVLLAAVDEHIGLEQLAEALCAHVQWNEKVVSFLCACSVHVIIGLNAQWSASSEVHRDRKRAGNEQQKESKWGATRGTHCTIKYYRQKTRWRQQVHVRVQYAAAGAPEWLGPAALSDNATDRDSPPQVERASARADSEQRKVERSIYEYTVFNIMCSSRMVINWRRENLNARKKPERRSYSQNLFLASQHL